ncbi:MAG: hypothetical protein WCW78_03120 [Candidatus Paceibacterota bacterium]|jgi:hypothetical protein
MNKKCTLLFSLIILATIGVGFYFLRPTYKREQEQTGKTTPQNLVYTNTEYNFTFPVPESWKDYSIITSTWEGYTINAEGQVPAEHGPLISIRHPLYTTEKPRQDIPIMVFTLAQWDLVSKEKIVLGAAPIGPSKLGENVRYVFALPARYNYAFPEGFEEVQTILDNHPLRAY